MRVVYREQIGGWRVVLECLGPGKNRWVARNGPEDCSFAGRHHLRPLETRLGGRSWPPGHAPTCKALFLGGGLRPSPFVLHFRIHRQEDREAGMPINLCLAVLIACAVLCPGPRTCGWRQKLWSQCS